MAKVASKSVRNRPRGARVERGIDAAKRALTPRRPAPTNPAGWLEEIAAAFLDARGAIPFGPLVGHAFGEGELFHLAPAMTVTFRGLRGSRALKRATDAALASYVANSDTHKSELENPAIAFAFCYLAGHYGLGLLREAAVERIMAYVERNRRALLELIDWNTKPNDGLQRTAAAAIVSRRR